MQPKMAKTVKRSELKGMQRMDSAKLLRSSNGTVALGPSNIGASASAEGKRSSMLAKVMAPRCQAGTDSGSGPSWNQDIKGAD